MRFASALLLILPLAAACGDDGGHTPDTGGAPTGAIAATVTHYDYMLDLDSLAAHATITATVTTAGDCFALPFRGAALAGKSVTINGVAAVSAHVADKTLTACGAGSTVGTTLTLDADLTVAKATLAPSQVGFSTEKDAQQNTYYYLVSWVGGCDQFAPCDSRPDQFATYTFHVTHSAGLVVRCPGTIAEPSPTVTTCDFAFHGGPTYSTFGLIASNAWTQTDKGMFGSVHVTVYDRASTGIAAKLDPAFHDGYIKFMESTFGPYPYGSELRVLTAPTYWNGFEHPGNIVLADTLAKQKEGYTDSLAHTLDHEMTHMWAGDQTTIAGLYDFAWKESMAEYLPFTYESAQSIASGEATAAVWKRDAAQAVYSPVPDDAPALIDYYSDVYGAGPLILFRQIEVMYSRAKVIAALKTLLGAQRAVSVDEVVAALSTATGEDLTAYAHAWLHGTGTPDWPRFQLTFTPAAGSGATSSLVVHQTNQDKGVRGCAFHVAIFGANAGESSEVLVDTFHHGPDQTIDVPTPAFTVVGTSVDPHNECLVFAPLATPAPHPRLWIAPARVPSRRAL